MTIHVLAHVSEAFRLAPRRWLRRTRREVTGAGTSQWLIAASLVAAYYSDFSCSVTWVTGYQRRRAHVSSPWVVGAIDGTIVPGPAVAGRSQFFDTAGRHLPELPGRQGHLSSAICGKAWPAPA